VIDMDEKQVTMKITGDNSISWFLDLTTSEKAKLPFKKISPSRIDCTFEGMPYFITAVKGSFSKPEKDIVFRLKPLKNVILLNMAESEPAK